MKRTALLGSVAAATVALAAAAADPPGKAKTCIPCHGPLGVATAPDAPHLAGQPEIYLEAQLKAFRDARRRHEVMNVMAKSLTDAEIAELARFYSSIRIEAHAPAGR